MYSWCQGFRHIPSKTSERQPAEWGRWPQLFLPLICCRAHNFLLIHQVVFSTNQGLLISANPNFTAPSVSGSSATLLLGTGARLVPSQRLAVEEAGVLNAQWTGRPPPRAAHTCPHPNASCEGPPFFFNRENVRVHVAIVAVVEPRKCQSSRCGRGSESRWSPSPSAVASRSPASRPPSRDPPGP